MSKNLYLDINVCKLYHPLTSTAMILVHQRLLFTAA